MPLAVFEPMPTAFVTFFDPAYARMACKYLAVHPENPLECLVTMAPSFEDLDWTRLMKSAFRGEVGNKLGRCGVAVLKHLCLQFVKDWVVNIGVW